MATDSHIIGISIINRASGQLRDAIARLWQLMTPAQRARYHLQPVVDQWDNPRVGAEYDSRYLAHVADCRVLVRPPQRMMH